MKIETTRLWGKKADAPLDYLGCSNAVGYFCGPGSEPIVAVGARSAKNSAGVRAGKVFLYRALSGEPVGAIEGDVVGQFCGFQIAMRNVTPDGFDDLLISGRLNINGTLGPTMTYILPGRALTSPLQLTLADFAPEYINGLPIGLRYPLNPALWRDDVYFTAMGDATGNGKPDLFLGQPGAYSPRSLGVGGVSVQFDALQPRWLPDVRILCHQRESDFGWHIQAIDLDGDGCVELLVGAPLMDCIVIPPLPGATNPVLASDTGAVFAIKVPTSGLDQLPKDRDGVPYIETTDADILLKGRWKWDNYGVMVGAMSTGINKGILVSGAPFANAVPNVGQDAGEFDVYSYEVEQ